MAKPVAKPQTDWHRLSSEEAAAHLDSDPQRGLSTEAAAAGLVQHGPNILTETRRQ